MKPLLATTVCLSLCVSGVDGPVLGKGTPPEPQDTAPKTSTASVDEFNETQKRLLNRVIKRIETNYSAIRSATYRVHHHSVDHTLTKPQEIIIEEPGGGRIYVATFPESKGERLFTIRGKSIRVDSGGGKLSMVLHDGILTMYMRADSLAKIRKPEEAANSWVAWDVRNIGSFAWNQSVTGVLKRLQIEHATSLTSNKGETTILVKGSGRYGLVRTYEFDGTVGFLPRKVVTYHPDSSIAQCMTISYTSVLNEKAWFPKSIDIEHFKQGATQSPDSGMVWVTTKLEVSDLLINVPIDDSVFELVLEPGTRIDRVGQHPTILR